MSTSTTAMSTRLAEQVAADVRQLTDPIHMAVGRRLVTHPCLLDQLRTSVAPPSSRVDGGRHQVPGSRVPINVQGSDALSTVYVEISGWHARLRLPSPPRYLHGCPHGSCRRALLTRSGLRPLCAPARLEPGPDWHKSVLWSLVEVAPTLTHDMATWLGTDVHEWWTLATRAAGWQPAELLRIR